MTTQNEFHFSTKPFRKALLPVASAAFLLVSGGISLFAQPVRIQDNEAQKAALQKVQPSYPAIARQLNLAGRVVVDLTVNASGSVEKVDVVNGNPILANAAVPAAKRWKFAPFQVDGKPTEAVVRIAFDFNK
ncbi:MAG TPA: energy transducer TonB [Bryobacteraceae bacterium]|nr:energy transducer TonB [Bryobacteraceae bacterium]